MTARVLVIGLDAAESTLLEKWASQGKLPTFASLMQRGAVYRLDNSLETLPGAIWPEIVSGRSCGAAPRYYHSKQLHTGEARLRPIAPEDTDPGDYFWTRASAAGCRVAVVDMPQTVESPSLNGIQLFEWGLHDRSFDPNSCPPGLLGELESRFGEHPISGCDLHGRTAKGYSDLLDGLLKGADTKSELLLELIGQEDWDLFTCTYGETHCVGHQFWHFLDDRHPWYREDAPEDFRNAMSAVYQKVDSGIGRLIAAAGEGATVLVIASHGMGPYLGGPQLLPEILLQLGMGSTAKPGSPMSRTLRTLQSYLQRLPRPLKPIQGFLKQMGKIGAVGRIQASAGSLLYPLESPATKAVTLKNNRCGAIRLNLKGREPFGRIEPGPEADRLLDEIRGELLALKDPKTGEPIVVETVTAQEAFGPDHHADVPDLMVVFRTDLGPLERCTSSSVGEIHCDLFHPDVPRSGDHDVESRLWMIGPEAPIPAHEPSPGNVLDIAPTILKLLDVPLPEDLDGKPLE